jgi:hypothetical protein
MFKCLYLAVLVSLVLQLSACALAPTPVAEAEYGTTISYDTVLYSQDDATVEAQKVCAGYGRKAVFRSVSGMGMRYASFDCVKL